MPGEVVTSVQQVSCMVLVACSTLHGGDNTQALLHVRLIRAARLAPLITIGLSQQLLENITMADIFVGYCRTFCRNQ